MAGFYSWLAPRSRDAVRSRALAASVFIEHARTPRFKRSKKKGTMLDYYSAGQQQVGSEWSEARSSGRGVQEPSPGLDRGQGALETRPSVRIEHQRVVSRVELIEQS